MKKDLIVAGDVVDSATKKAEMSFDRLAENLANRLDANDENVNMILTKAIGNGTGEAHFNQDTVITEQFYESGAIKERQVIHKKTSTFIKDSHND